MSDSLASDNNQLDDSPAVDITGKIMVVIIILLFIVIVTFLFFHLFAKGFWWTQSRRSSDNNSQSRRRRRSGQEGGGGLDPSVLNSLPISIFNSKEDGLDLECSVCLSEVVEGEKVRVLPKCNHMFHIDCIDMWFHSHSTCPLCRTTLAATPPPSSVVVEVESSTSAAAAAASFPTNVLIWGNHNQITSSSSSSSATSEQNTSSSSSDSDNTINNNNRGDDEGNGMLRIDIPNECEATTSSSSPLASAEGRLKSLKRLLSSSSRGIMSLNPWSPTSTVQQQTKPKEAAGQS